MVQRYFPLQYSLLYIMNALLKLSVVGVRRNNTERRMDRQTGMKGGKAMQRNKRRHNYKLRLVDRGANGEHTYTEREDREQYGQRETERQTDRQTELQK